MQMQAQEELDAIIDGKEKEGHGVPEAVFYQSGSKEPQGAVVAQDGQ